VLLLVRDQWSEKAAFGVAIACGLTAAYVPYGYAVALIGGTVVSLMLASKGGE